MPQALDNPTDLLTPGFWVGDWCVFPDLDRVTRGESMIHVEPKVMDLLVFLARHPGVVVTKHDIIDAVWHGNIVASSALSRCVTLLRKALRDDVRHPRYIETIPKRGYRLTASVKGIESMTSNMPASTFRLRLGEREYPLFDGEYTIGRSPDALVRIDSPTVSRHHARIRVDGDQALLEDLDSKNGTYVRGRLVTAPTVLENGDEIIAGSTAVKFIDVRAIEVTETLSGLARPSGDRGN